MRTLRDIPIKRKLTIITTLTSVAALLLSCLVFLIGETVLERTDMADNLLYTAQMVGYNSSAALSFNDPVSASETLKFLTASPDILGGAVYDKSGRLFAKYQRAILKSAFNPPAVEPDGHRFTGHSLQLFYSVNLAGEKIGTVYIESTLDELYVRLWRYSFIIVVVMIGAFFVAFLLSTRMQTVISGPISHLAGVVGVVANKKDYSIRAVKQGEDELGQLIDGFNDMLTQIQTQDSALQEARSNLEKRVKERTKELEDTQAQLLEASRRGGMAEIASNVLHNVGNALNSVNVSVGLLADSARTSKVASFPKVVALLRKHEGDLATFITSDPRGKQLPAYLAQLSENLLADRDATVRELISLQRSIKHVNDIVAMQQNYAKVSGVKEIVNVKNLIEDSLQMNMSALSRHSVEVIREYEDVPPLNIEKHKVVQVLVNLIRNAKYACDDSGREDKRLTLRVAGGNDTVRISVVDNGVGISPENMTRIFSHGFTTREGGHGFGLHSSALAAKEMGGSLTVQSDGPGRGATFTLELPYETSEVAHG
jgi:two-component system, NtrC family, sensor kinase